MWRATPSIPAGWSQNGLNYFSSNRASYLSPDGYVQSGIYDLTGYDKMTVMIYSEPFNSDNTLTVTTSVDSKNVTLPTNASFAWYTFVVNCASSDYIKITSSGVAGFREMPTRFPQRRISSIVFAGWLAASTWNVIPSAPAIAKGVRHAQNVSV